MRWTAQTKALLHLHIGRIMQCLYVNLTVHLYLIEGGGFEPETGLQRPV